MRLRKDLAEVRHPQAQNSVAALHALPSTLALSVDDIVEAVHPPMSVLALPLHTALSLAEELPIELRDEMPLVRGSDGTISFKQSGFFMIPAEPELSRPAPASADSSN